MGVPPRYILTPWTRVTRLEAAGECDNLAMRVLSTVLVVALVSAGILYGAKLYTDSDEAYDFSGLRTYQWKTHPVSND